MEHFQHLWNEAGKILGMERTWMGRGFGGVRIPEELDWNILGNIGGKANTSLGWGRGFQVVTGIWEPLWDPLGGILVWDPLFWNPLDGILV